MKVNKSTENTLSASENPEALCQYGRLSDTLGFLLRISQIEVFSEFYEHFSRLNLKPGEFSVLYMIHINPGIRQGALAKAMCIKPAHMTKMVRSQETRGLVLREVPDIDRRVVLLRLSEKGQQFVADNEESIFDFAKTELQRLSATESRHLMQLLRKFTGISGKVEKNR